MLSSVSRDGFEGSQTTRSASLPGAITPFCGYSPKMRAGAVQATSTSRSGESGASPSIADANPSGSRAPMPGRPVGTCVKSPATGSLSRSSRRWQ